MHFYRLIFVVIFIPCRECLIKWSVSRSSFYKVKYTHIIDSKLNEIVS